MKLLILKIISKFWGLTVDIADFIRNITIRLQPELLEQYRKINWIIYKIEHREE